MTEQQDGATPEDGQDHGESDAVDGIWKQLEAFGLNQDMIRAAILPMMAETAEGVVENKIAKAFTRIPELV